MNKLLLFLIVFLFSSCQYFGSKEETNPTPKNPTQKLIADLDNRIVDSPKNASLYFQRANLYWKLGENEKALTDFYKTVSYDSTKATYYETLAAFFVENANVDRGILALTYALKLEPNNSKYHVMSGKYNLYLKNYQAAINHLNNALKKDIFNPQAYFYKGYVYYESKNDEKAISNLVTATEQDPTWDEPYELLGQIYADKKDDICLKYFDNAARANPKNTSALSQKAYYLKHTQRTKEASEIYEKLVVNNPQDADALYNLGVISYDLKDYKKALKQLEICVGIDPAYAPAYFMIGQVQKTLNNSEAAKKAFKTASILDTSLVEAKAELKNL